MTDSQLNAVLAVAEEGSFVRAAERLMVSQPAVSLHVSELEGNLKLKLFDRLPRLTRPTEAGLLLAEFARRIQAVRAEADAAMADLRGVRRGRLAVGATLTIGAYLLPDWLGRFRRAHPEIELELVVANTERVQQRLRDGVLDVGFTEGDPGGEGLRSTVFAQDELVALVPPGHPLLEHKRVTAAMFCRYPLIARESGSGTRAVAERALALRGLVIKPSLVLPQAEAIMRCVAEGLGVAILSRLAAQRDLTAGKLVQVKLTDLAIRRPLHVERPSARADSPALAQLPQLARKIFFDGTGIGFPGFGRGVEVPKFDVVPKTLGPAVRYSVPRYVSASVPAIFGWTNLLLLEAHRIGPYRARTSPARCRLPGRPG